MPVIRKFTPLLASIIDESARKCFGNLPMVNYRTGFKILKQQPIGPLMSRHEFDFNNGKVWRQQLDPTFKTEEEERSADALFRLKARGKGPPKKGQGKRATKKR